MRNALFLLGLKGLVALEAILSKEGLNHSSMVIVGEDGSVENDFSSDIVDLCNAHDLPFVYREKTPDANDFDYAFAIGWRWMIRGFTDEQLIVFHDSLLPRYRGFAPLVNAALNMETNVGVTALIGASKYDTGDIISQRKISVAYPIRIGDLIDEIAPLYGALLVDIIRLLNEGHKLSLEKQDECLASYSPWLDEKDYWIDWSADSTFISNKINLLGPPYRHAKTDLDGSIVELVSAEVFPAVKMEHQHVGKIIFVEEDGCPVIACGVGLVKVTVINSESGLSLLPLKSFRMRFGS